MDDRAKNTINCGLDVNDYNVVSTCETTQEMCRMLEFTQKDTNQVKETKKNTLVLQYDAFKMKEHESINEIYSRFALIINGLQLLGKVYPKNRMEAKVTAIQEAKDLNVLKLEEFVVSLMTHEITIKIHDEEATTSKNKSLALKAEVSHELE
ncbi:hypothetical protein RJ640_002890 [Escallonia rubra]|uniref:UBN2 domain-containing protein n=1 Tax=Escallonia rubra TaxID=112253 RepID=A0AA88RJW8_9ASTE|nr:hypothetical protein RJ640_002890 [Escallonia rubra]